jgi:hypothetical protein
MRWDESTICGGRPRIAGVRAESMGRIQSLELAFVEEKK